MRAYPVGCVIVVVGSPVDCVGALVVVKTKDIFFCQHTFFADIDPAIVDGPIFGGVCRGHGHVLGIRLRIWNFALNAIGGIFYLAKEGRDDFLISFECAFVGSGTIVFDQLVQFGQRKKRHQGKHVMLNMVVHVHTEKARNRIHINGATVQAMIQYVFR